VDLLLELTLALSSMVLGLQSKHIGIEGQNGMDWWIGLLGYWIVGFWKNSLAFSHESNRVFNKVCRKPLKYYYGHA